MQDVGCEQSAGRQIPTVDLLLLLRQKAEAVRFARRKALHTSRRPSGRESFCSLSLSLLFSPPPFHYHCSGGGWLGTVERGNGPALKHTTATTTSTAAPTTFAISTAEVAQRATVVRIVYRNPI